MSYIFTPPAVAYDVKFTFESMDEYIRRGRNKDSRKVGTTVTLIRDGLDDIAVWLYQTKIGSVARGGNRVVWISPEINSHGSQATTWWVQKIISDNKLPGYVAREKGAYAVAGKEYRR